MGCCRCEHGVLPSPRGPGELPAPLLPLPQPRSSERQTVQTAVSGLFQDTQGLGTPGLSHSCREEGSEPLDQRVPTPVMAIGPEQERPSCPLRTATRPAPTFPASTSQRLSLPPALPGSTHALPWWGVLREKRVGVKSQSHTPILSLARWSAPALQGPGTVSGSGRGLGSSSVPESGCPGYGCVSPHPKSWTHKPLQGQSDPCTCPSPQSLGTR